MPHRYAERFRGFLPVVVDIESGGFDCERHALFAGAENQNRCEIGWL